MQSRSEQSRIGCTSFPTGWTQICSSRANPTWRSADLQVGFARLEQICVHPVGNDVHPILLCSERDCIVTQWSRDGEHRVGARERPALSSRSQISEPGGPVGGLLHGQR